MNLEFKNDYILNEFTWSQRLMILGVSNIGMVIATRKCKYLIKIINILRNYEENIDFGLIYICDLEPL